MPDTVQHRVDMHLLSRNRINAGLPSWAGRINIGGILRNEDATFEETRDRFVATIKASRWYLVAAKDLGFNDLVDCVDEMSDAREVSEFDEALSGLYDLADTDRIWLDRHTPAADLGALKGGR